MENFAKTSLAVVAFGICLNAFLSFPGFLLDLIDLELISKKQIDDLITNYYYELILIFYSFHRIKDHFFVQYSISLFAK